MTKQTHAYLGAELFPVICETWNISLSRKRFIFGSIKPDISSLFFRHPHFWRHSRKFVFHKIRKLSKVPLKAGKKNKKFSEDLGVVLHYVADFFTAVHNVKPNILREHLAFEENLYRDFLHLVDSNAIRNTMRMITGTEKPDPTHMENFLRERHRRYQPSKTDHSNDINEILIACVYVTAAIMNSVTANLNEANGFTPIAQPEAKPFGV